MSFRKGTLGYMTPDLPPSTTRELLRARMAHLATAQAAALSAARRRHVAQEHVAQEKRFRDPLLLERAEQVLASERQREDAALDELGRALVAAVRFVGEHGAQLP